MSLSEAKVRTSQPQDGIGMNFVIKLLRLRVI